MVRNYGVSHYKAHNKRAQLYIVRHYRVQWYNGTEGHGTKVQVGMSNADPYAMKYDILLERTCQHKMLSDIANLSLNIIVSFFKRQFYSLLELKATNNLKSSILIFNYENVLSLKLLLKNTMKLKSFPVLPMESTQMEFPMGNSILSRHMYTYLLYMLLGKCSNAKDYVHTRQCVKTLTHRK